MLFTVTLMFAVLLASILQGVVCPGSVYSVMPQRWHLMVLKHVPASFHLPSVSTANINIVQYPTQYKQCEIPTVPAVVIFKVLLPQFNIMVVFVRSNSCQFSDSSPGLPTYKNHYVTQFTVYSLWVFLTCWDSCIKCPTVNIKCLSI